MRQVIKNKNLQTFLGNNFLKRKKKQKNCDLILRSPAAVIQGRETSLFRSSWRDVNTCGCSFCPERCT